MDVKMSNIILVLYKHPIDALGRQGPLVNPHGIGKGTGEEIIIADRNLRYDIRERAGFFTVEMRQGGYMLIVW